jgi:hypothetical protein
MKSEAKFKVVKVADVTDLGGKKSRSFTMVLVPPSEEAEPTMPVAEVTIIGVENALWRQFMLGANNHISFEWDGLF